MPVILPEAARLPWLDPAERDEHRLSALLTVFPADLLESYPVSTRVNSPDHDDPDCLVPLTDAEREAARRSSRPSRAARHRPAASAEPDLFDGA
jgi:hypothetical protein